VFLCLFLVENAWFEWDCLFESLACFLVFDDFLVEVCCGGSDFGSVVFVEDDCSVFDSFFVISVVFVVSVDEGGGGVVDGEVVCDYLVSEERGSVSIAHTCTVGRKVDKDGVLCYDSRKRVISSIASSFEKLSSDLRSSELPASPSLL